MPRWPSKPSVRDLTWSLLVFTPSFSRGMQREPQYDPPQTQAPAFRQQHCLSQSSPKGKSGCFFKAFIYDPQKSHFVTLTWRPFPCHHRLQSYYPCLLRIHRALSFFPVCSRISTHVFTQFFEGGKKKIIQSAIFGSFTPLSHNTDK